MTRFYTLLAGIVLSLAMATAQTFTFTNAASVDQTIDSVHVVIAKASGTTDPTYNNGLRLYANNTITISGRTITSVTLTFSKQGKKDYATLSATPGTLTSGGVSSDNSDLKDDVWTGSARSVVFTMGASGQRLLHQIVVVASGSTTPDTTIITPDTTAVVPSTLDTAYVYPDTVRLSNTDSIGSNLVNYSFIQNNVEVRCTKGARTNTYFSCNANESMTFTATKPIKGITISGYVKAGFEATASAGNVSYVATDADPITADPVVVVYSINSKQVTINCNKQIRCYEVRLFFAANPTDSIESDDDYGYSFDWEPQETTTLNPVFTEHVVYDMTAELQYVCTAVTLSNDDYELELDIFASLNENGLLPDGIYPIDSTYREGTVMASPGGTDEYDFPSALYTGFFQEDGEWYYNTVYYLTGGTLTIAAVDGGSLLTLAATTAKGSRINTSYTLTPETPVENTEAKSVANKVLKNGQLFITKGDKTFDVLGRVRK